VLGLVGRDVLFEIVGIVADEDAPRAFEAAARIVEQGYDLRLVCRELSRLVRDLLVISVDPKRISDPEIAAEGERETLVGLARRFSREDLLRAFDVLGRAENEVRVSAQPRYNLEMALLRWIHLRKLVPLAELLQGGAGPTGAPGPPAPRAPAMRPPSTRQFDRPASPARTPRPPERPAPVPAPAAGGSEPAPGRPAQDSAPRPAAVKGKAADSGGLKDAFLAEVRRARAVLYNTVIAQAQSIDVEADRVTFTYLPRHRTLREKLDQSRGWLEEVATQAAGRTMTVVSAGHVGEASGSVDKAPAGASRGAEKPAQDLKAEAMADAAVQAMLDVFPAEISDVEEM
jgi:DNA polymerase-3 subunit gamma/tau